MDEIIFSAARLPTTQVEHAQFLARHPVTRSQEEILHSSLETFCGEGLLRVALGQPSLPVIGKPRLGKSRALVKLKRDLVATYKRLHVSEFECVRLDPHSMSTLWEHLLMDLGETLGARESPARLKNKVLKHILIDAHSAGADQIVLIFDEFQKWQADTLTDLSWLVNKLIANGFRVTCICVGSPAMRSVYNALSSTVEGLSALSRFYQSIVNFDGVKTVGELRKILTAYDDFELCEYPTGSGWSFSQAFRPQAFAAGWRLHTCAQRLFDAFELRRGNKAKVELSAESWSMAIRYILAQSADFESTDDPVTDELLAAAVEDRSGFMDIKVLDDQE